MPNAVTPTGFSSPLDLAYPFQRRWIDEPAQFALGLWGRQLGKDWSTAGLVTRDCHRRPGTTWMIAAPSERQSLETFAKCREWCAAWRASMEFAGVARSGAEDVKAAAIHFANGSRIFAVPGRPDTVRGFSANLVFTEAAFFDDLDATWRAVLPSITSPLRGGKKMVRLITTPRTRGDMIHRIFQDVSQPKRGAKPSPWALHRVTIHDAARDGMPLDVEAIRGAMSDPSGFAVECECEFHDDAQTAFPYELIAAAEHSDATATIGADWWARARANVFLGIDFGRTTDPTICVALERVGDVLWTREILRLDAMASDEQERILRPRLACASRVAIDATGGGTGLADWLVKTFREWAPNEHKFGKVERCTFTASLKREIFPRLRRCFEAPVRLRIPDEYELREDIHAMRQVSRPSGFVYSAPRTDDGHSDRCTALALAVRAADAMTAGSVAYSAVSRGITRAASRSGSQPQRTVARARHRV